MYVNHIYDRPGYFTCERVPSNDRCLTDQVCEVEKTEPVCQMGRMLGQSCTEICECRLVSFEEKSRRLQKSPPRPHHKP